MEHTVRKRADIHYPKPRALSITQSTERGTLYTPEELRAIGDQARRLSLKVQMDGSRFANAVAALGLPPSELTCWAGNKPKKDFFTTKHREIIAENGYPVRGSLTVKVLPLPTTLSSRRSPRCFFTIS